VAAGFPSSAEAQNLNKEQQEVWQTIFGAKPEPRAEPAVEKKGAGRAEPCLTSGGEAGGRASRYSTEATLSE